MSNRDEKVVIVPAETRYYAMLFRDVADAYTEKVGISAMWLYTRFLMEMNFTTKFSPPLSYSRLAKLCCMDRSTVIVKVQALIEHGLLKVVPPDQVAELQSKGLVRHDENLEGCNIYQVIDPFYMRHPEAPVSQTTDEKEVVGKSDQSENPPSRKIHLVGKSTPVVGKSDQGVVGKSDTYVKEIRSKRSNPKDANASSSSQRAKRASDKASAASPSADVGSEGVTAKKVFAADSEAIRLCLNLRFGILSINPDADVPREQADDKELQKWALDMDRMMRIDRRDYELVNEVIKWIYTGDPDFFWQKVVQSPSGLRRNFDKINVRRIAGAGKTKPTGPIGKPITNNHLSGNLVYSGEGRTYGNSIENL